MTDPVTRHVFALRAADDPVAGCAECSAPRDAPQHYRVVELTDVGRKWLTEVQSIDAQLKAIKTPITAPLDARRELAVTNLQAEIGDAEAALVNGRAVVLWVYAKARDGIDLEALKSALPDVYRRFYKPAKPARPFKPVGGGA